jgi:hypothetical protein
MLIFITILKAIIICIGMPFVTFKAIRGIRGDREQLKKAGVIFLSIFISIVLLTAVEFMFYVK